MGLLNCHFRPLVIVILFLDILDNGETDLNPVGLIEFNFIINRGDENIYVKVPKVKHNWLQFTDEVSCISLPTPVTL